VLAGILFRLRPGCQWKALPKEYFGSVVLACALIALQQA
jgi:hypothetical protein